MLIICSRCDISKNTSDFYKSKSSKSGYQTYCVECTKKRNSSYGEKYRSDNREKLRVLSKDYYERNSDLLKINMREYHIKTKDTRLAYKKKHYELNKSIYLHYSRLRKLKLVNATPPWLDEENFENIKQIYMLSKKLTEETGVAHEVDHIVPINGKTVCGLHVPWNLQILTKEENSRKSNKYDHV